MVVRVLDVLFAFIEGILALQLILELLGANPYTRFTEWVYVMSSPFIQPFEGIFPGLPLGSDHVFDLSIFCALIVYAALGWFVVHVFSLTMVERQSV